MTRSSCSRNRSVPILTCVIPLLPGAAHSEQVHIILPSLLSIKTVIDRMKSISGDVIFSANLSGEMRLRVQSDAASVETEWRDLRHPELGALAPLLLDMG